MTPRAPQDGPDPIRIVVADDHPIVRAGIVGLLETAPGIEVVGEAADGAEAVELAASERPDLVLMDLRMPGVDGASATASIVASGSGTRVLVLTTYETDDHILAAIEAGASGYLLKAAPQASNNRLSPFTFISRSFIISPHAWRRVSTHPHCPAE